MLDCEGKKEKLSRKWPPRTRMTEHEQLCSPIPNPDFFGNYTIFKDGGATVAERLACYPPTKAIRVQSRPGYPDFCMWESCRTMPLVGGFSWGSPVSPTI
ncbi:hypothetical protein PR048_023320 [Dryococelus australis]|uniref:Uncharacterized protein n=1 Tax=Dryococelus australis TaxID=614101 RepID=A0ABQ9GTR2_9NEOP|nr:hypothetical protein PR048_023320 [Dryococelus australis]